MNVARGGFGGFGRPQQNAAPPQPVANQKLEEVIDKWPKGDIPARIGDYMFRPWQRWTISPVEGKGAYLGNTYFKIVI
jgi:arabinan endo-1,5-alpha-L-arabinosidase